MMFIGPHVSIAGNIALAPSRAYELGATAFALFSKNQRVWKAPPLKDEDAQDFKASCITLGYAKEAILPHAGYLINPASPDKELWDKSLSLFLEEADRILSLGLDVINIHPGAFREGSREDGIRRCAAMLDEVLSSRSMLRIAIENTAGAGTILGSSFEELDSILSSIRNQSRAGITLDTAHLFGAGYDVSSSIDRILDDFDARFGSDKLFGMHLNDSKVPLSSNKDRHAPLGDGYIGKDAFRAIVSRNDVQDKPLILETPDESRWKEEIAFLISSSAQDTPS